MDTDFKEQYRKVIEHLEEHWRLLYRSYADAFIAICDAAGIDKTISVDDFAKEVPAKLQTLRRDLAYEKNEKEVWHEGWSKLQDALKLIFNAAGVDWDESAMGAAKEVVEKLQVKARWSAEDRALLANTMYNRDRFRFALDKIFAAFEIDWSDGEPPVKNLLNQEAERVKNAMVTTQILKSLFAETGIEWDEEKDPITIPANLLLHTLKATKNDSFGFYQELVKTRQEYHEMCNTSEARLQEKDRQLKDAGKYRDEFCKMLVDIFAAAGIKWTDGRPPMDELLRKLKGEEKNMDEADPHFIVCLGFSIGDGVYWATSGTQQFTIPQKDDIVLSHRCIKNWRDKLPPNLIAINQGYDEDRKSNLYILERR